ncbi:hypothetical protein LCGC14_0767030 [marine sediment metagenome]|uniref:Uncharacterized protein n=1 Tax=marine sediment metagenome TaxID=412755 RepID=A0A0F9Q3N2_9ZZZZ
MKFQKVKEEIHRIAQIYDPQKALEEIPPIYKTMN